MRSAARMADDAAARPGAASPGTPKPPTRGRPGDVGEALRAVYREAVAEQVPDEMLDLLNKLG